MSIWAIVSLILGYFLRHYDPTGLHTPEGPLEQAAKEIDKQAKEKQKAELLAKLTGGSPPAPPGAI